MGLRTQFRRHRKDTRLIVGGLGALLLLFSGLFYLLLYNQDLEARVINNRVLLFALWYANVVLILAVLVVLFRIVFKILVQAQAPDFSAPNSRPSSSPRISGSLSSRCCCSSSSPTSS